MYEFACDFFFLFFFSIANAASYTYSTNMEYSVYISISLTLSFWFDIADVLKACNSGTRREKSRICLFMRYFQEKENCCYISLQFPFCHLKLNLKLFFCLKANTQYHYSKLGKHFTPHSRVEKTFVVNIFFIFCFISLHFRLP